MLMSPGSSLHLCLLLLFLLSLFLFGPVNATLSKSGRKQTKVDKEIKGIIEEDSQTERTKKLGQNGEKQYIEVEEEVNLKENILAEHTKLDISGGRKFKGEVTLGYVTPWNTHGYDIAKWAANKFTHISPVWFQLRPGELDGQLTCRVDGTHDIDMGWVADIRHNNSQIRIVPRFIFEGWTGAQLQQFLSQEQAQYRCIKGLIEFMQRHNFDGAVVEIWLQIMSMTRGSAAQFLLELIEFWSEQFHRAHLQFILPLTPLLDANNQEIGIVNHEIIRRLLASVDYINLMTYDFPSPEITGVAPLNWVLANLHYIIENAEHFEESHSFASKILMGLNFYGYDRSGGKNEAIVGVKYVELLSLSDAQLSFDRDPKEHKLTYGEHGVVYYPTQKSIEIRVEMAREMDLGGIAIWDLGQGLNHFTFVL